MNDDPEYFSQRERQRKKKPKNFTNQKLIDKQKTDLCADRELLLRSKLVRQDVLGFKKKRDRRVNRRNY